MKIQHQQVAPDLRNDRTEALEKADEVQLAHVQQTQQADSSKQPVILAGDFAATIGDADASSVTSQGSPDSLFALKKANRKALAGEIDVTELNDRIGTLAVQEFSEAAQAQFIKFLDSKRASGATLSRVASKLRQSLPPESMMVRPLRQHLNSKGVRLFSNDKLGADHPGFHLDRKAFRQSVVQLADKGEPLSKRDVRTLLAPLGSVVDRSDLFYAHWQIKRRLYEGTLTIADGGDAKRLQAFFAERLEGEVDRKEVSYLAQAMRAGDFDDASVAAFRELVGRSKDPDLLFHAERFAMRELAEAKNGATKRSPEQLPHLQAVEAQLSSFLAPRLKGQLDRHTVRREAIASYRAGDIDRAQVAGMMSAIAISYTPEQFAEATMVNMARLNALQAQSAILAAWSELVEAMSRAWSDDETDSEGRIIETAGERHVRRVQRERMISRLRIEPRKLEVLATRAQLRASKGSLRSVITQARTPEQRADAVGAQGSLEGAAVDAEMPLDSGGG